ncbi:MAG: DUF4230 domain-containing protein [Verrucomicrobia bacterium]|nr:DUF4230 domain-containing protein [Verrucomicrobiota bacterium]OQC65963.1 MAG: hypothetical protein BWX48_02021 [Verrucomicrobia bacterium ADurb.Bin006]MDI9379289.1 DUF4230 domain-containing protein [Verrucomicrobiota bacterium]NMD19582.1 DUF4230 domain-containing protein [Verrucomicrobiota bacterium]HOA62250.1 DUF4230 domain-containing protein [Verrucomicrobiota bacterium]
MQPATRNRLTALAISLLAIALGLGLAFGWTVVRLLRPDRSPRFTNTAAVLTQIQGLAQLVTVKYVMEKVVILEDVRIYGENRVLLVAHGVVKAGVDLSKIERGDIEVDGTNVTIRLPRCTITDVYLDEDKTQVLEHSTGLLRRFDKDLQQNARREGLDAIRRAARDSGILDEAQTRAELQLRLFFNQFGFTEIEFRK